MLWFLCCVQTLAFTNSNNVAISGLTSLNSQMFHIVLNGCQNVKVQGVKVIADGNSPNTDGIHVQMSSYVTILNSKIRTGDDCISIGPGTTNLWIENIACGPGHGIRSSFIQKFKTKRLTRLLFLLFHKYEMFIWILQHWELGESF